ncbi:MAG: alanine racemase [Novosphingobium sp.]|nr:alanine racemase [Novosphingobium sp.]
MQPDLPAAALRLEIDSQALAGNWRALARLSGQAAAGAAIKADGYGVGARRVAKVLSEAGCRDFFIAHWREFADLRDVLEPSSVSVLHGPLTPADAAYGKALGLKPAINTLHQAKLWLEADGGPCDVMIDTGMNRLGLPMSEIGNEALKKLDIDVLMSHLASADEDVPLNERQRKAWEEAKSALSSRRSSLANSAGIALGSAYHGELTRPGLSLYGGIQRQALEEHIRPVVRPMAAILQVREIEAGDSVGYNATFVATQHMRVGTIALGYADGYLRCWSGKGAMLSQGRRIPVLGRVSMDLTCIDLSAVPELAEGDWVEAEYSLPHAAAVSGMSQYELLTGLGRRFSR